MGGRKKEVELKLARQNRNRNLSRGNTGNRGPVIVSGGNENLIQNDGSRNSGLLGRNSGMLQPSNMSNEEDLVFDFNNLENNNPQIDMGENEDEDIKAEEKVIDNSVKPKNDDDDEAEAEPENDRGADFPDWLVMEHDDFEPREKLGPADVSDWMNMEKADFNQNNRNPEPNMAGAIPEHHGKRHKQGFFSKRLDDVTGKIGSLTGATFTLITLPVAGINALSGKAKLHSAKKKMADARDHKTVPGWGGTKYSKTKKATGEDILADFRRVPTVWSYATPSKAVDTEGNPKDPEISVYIDQPKTGSSRSLLGSEMGHAMIGLHFSKFSKLTGKYERYSIKYGFYPAGGFIGPAAQTVQAIHDAYVPGEMRDDRVHPYDISRRYKATSKQINDIVKATETYADNGYGYYERNCTTFVKEMVVDTAHLNTGGSIFGKERIRFQESDNVKRWGGATLSPYMKASFRKGLARRSKEEDLSYQSYGNKRVTKQDVKTFERTYNKSDKSVKMGYIPAATGENMRRKYGEDAGTTGSMKYTGSLGDNIYEADTSFAALKQALTGGMQELQPALQDYFTAHNVDIGQWPEELRDGTFLYGNVDNTIGDLSDKFDNYVTENHLEGAVDPKDALALKDVMEAYDELEKARDSLEKLYRVALGSEKSLEEPVMNMISLINIGILVLEDTYSSMHAKRETAAGLGELGTIRSNMTEKKYTVTVGDVSTRFTPSHYESYLQIYKNPQTAVQSYHRFKVLQQKKERKERLTEAEKAEFRVLSRKEDLAKEFDKAHQYLLEKNGFTQKDIDYVFSLKSLERKNGAKGNMLVDKGSAAGIYQTLFMEKFFGGMRERYRNGDHAGSLTDQVIEEGKPKVLRKAVAEWLDTDLTACVERKEGGMVSVIKGMRNADPKHVEKTLIKEVGQTVRDYYLIPVFAKGYPVSTPRDMVISQYMQNAYADVINNSKSKFSRLIKKLVGEALHPKPAAK